MKTRYIFLLALIAAASLVSCQQMEKTGKQDGNWKRAMKKLESKEVKIWLTELFHQSLTKFG